ncbi:glucose 1-dehydrogenase [Halobacteriales archaeon SW_10_68_16]|jgi:NAD(P)-dependent dehydrogenase (short-subunit alcohol dehydrogenase family)|nr:MAG: glucose 1-dehydrogenase [Halobacteriales archaeon SW_10_68_16]
MAVSFDFGGDIVLVTGVGGALGSSVAETFLDAGATVCGADLVAPDSEDFLLADPDRIDFYQADFTDEQRVSEVVESVVDAHGGLDYLANIAGTWRGGDPLDETDADTFEFLMAVNLKTMFLATKHALPHLQDSEGAVVSVSSRSSLEGGSGDAIYRATKAGVRILTESVAEENLGTVRANAIMPSVIDTPMNREMMPDADHQAWVDPADIADVVALLCSDAASPTSGAAVPVYGEA